MTCNTWSNRTVLQQFKEQVSLDGLERPGINLQQPCNIMRYLRTSGNASQLLIKMDE